MSSLAASEPVLADSRLAAHTSTLARLAPAADRCLPVDPVLADLLPEGGLRRGHVVACGGPAATSLALAVVAQAAARGAWVAAVGIPALGVEAAAELGVPLERLVLVDAGRTPSEWAERLAAAADGFELLLTAPPPGAERVVRRVRQRLQACGAVLVTIGPATIASDVQLTTARCTWEGLGDGYGALIGRHLTVECGGRRVPRPRTADVWLPGPGGGIARR